MQYTGGSPGEFHYQHHDKFVFLELDDLPRLPAGPIGTEPRSLGLLLADALPRFGLTVSEMQNANCHRLGEQYFLEVTAACGFDQLPADKACYFYYHTHLLDEAARLRRTLPERALQRSQPEAVSLCVQHHQHALQHLLRHALNQLPARYPLTVHKACTR